MKVAYVLGRLNRGGTEILALDIFNNIDREKIDIRCIYRSNGILYNEFFNTGVPLVKYSGKIKFILQLRRYIKNEKIQIVHAHLFFETLFSFIAAFGLKAKVIYSLHSFGVNEKSFLRAIRSFLLKKTSCNIYVSKTLLDFYLKEFHIKNEGQYVLHNCIDFNKMKARPDLNLRKTFNIPKRTLLIGTVGNFTSVRDYDTIMRFIGTLNTHKIAFKVLIAGAKSNTENQIYDNCIKYCQDNHLNDKVIFLGTRDDIPSLLKQLDIFVYATNRDTFGIAVIEAIAMSIPVFVNDWQVMLEITKNGKYATIYKSKNENDLLIKIKDYLCRPDVYKLKASISASEVIRDYSIDQYIQRLVNIYTKQLN